MCDIAGLERRMGKRMDEGFRQMAQRMDKGFRQIIDFLDRRL